MTVERRTTIPPERLGQLWRAGAEAVRRGEGREARAAFEALIAHGESDPAIYIGLALAQKALGSLDGQEEALAQALQIDPRNIRALMMRADLYIEARHDLRAASAYLWAVVRLGEEPGGAPPELQPEVERAKRLLKTHSDQFEAHLRAALEAEGLWGPGGGRVAHSLDLLLGKKKIYLQEPTQHYFPGLPQVGFYDRALCPWLDEAEAATGEIRAELLEVLKDEALFRPYVERPPDRPFFDHHGLLDNPAWSAFYLWKNGALVQENAARCPKTVEVVGRTPLCAIPGRTPSVLFSLLRPGARIPPHHGFLNSRFIVHLPLVAPEGCALRVGDEVRAWEEGRAFVFDDSVEHEAWNGSERLRVVLLFDVWRPELTPLERRLLARMLQAVDAFGGPFAQEWS
jgi:aspartyl/asparaginyl beta-hydroxylase (cupin superfamily)